MPSPSPTQPEPARRALLEDVRRNRRSWLQHGAAALAVSALGLGVAGAFAVTGSAQSTAAPAPQTSAPAVPAGPSASSMAGARDSAPLTSRSRDRASLDPAKVQSLADQRAEELAKTDDKITAAAAGRKVDEREKKLAETVDKTQDQAKRLAAGEKPASTTSDEPDDSAPAPAKGKSCLPLASYRVAATFGQVGSWARYHTGFDFSAPLGTALRAPGSGVVTNAGTGPATWAGNYVVIKYPDGTASLMAHMSTVSVRVGQKVSACETVGAIGMTGRTFGPHVHFEIYPAGITPGDVYRAVNPLGWFKARRLNP